MPPDRTFDLHDSGHNHLKPFLTGLVICLIVGAIALFLTGAPH